MSQLSKTFSILAAVACLLLLSSASLAAGPAVSCPYLPMPMGVSSGSVSVRVTTADTTHGISDAYVAIVNATDTSVIYAIGHTDGIGNYTFTSANSTGGADAYRILAIKDGYSDGISNRFEVRPSNTTHAFVVCQALITSMSASLPIVDPRVSSGTGYVSGRIKMGNGQSLSDATVQVTGSGDYLNIIYASARTDGEGRYAIDMASVSSEPAFMLLVKKDGYMDAYSIPFSIGPSSPVTIDLTDHNVFPTATPQPRVTPTPGPTATPAPSSTPAPTTSVPATTPSPTQPAMQQVTPTAPPSEPATTGTPVPVATTPAAPGPAPGFATVIAIIGIVALAACKRLR